MAGGVSKALHRIAFFHLVTAIFGLSRYKVRENCPGVVKRSLAIISCVL